MNRRSFVLAGALLAFAGPAWSQTTRPAGQDPDLVELVSGVVQKIDAAARSAVVKLKDGTTHTIHWNDKTTKHGPPMKEGTTVVVKAFQDAGKKTAEAFKVLGQQTADVFDGTVTKVDQATRTVYAKSVSGVETAFEFAKDGVIGTGRAIGTSAQAGGRAAQEAAVANKDLPLSADIKSGAHIIAHYSTEAGRKIAHAWMIKK